jgi:hypothetical protein
MTSEKDRNQAIVDRSAQSRIGRRLRAEYRGLTGSPLPDDQVHLLLALRHKERDRRRGREDAEGE